MAWLVGDLLGGSKAGVGFWLEPLCGTCDIESLSSRCADWRNYSVCHIVQSFYKN